MVFHGFSLILSSFRCAQSAKKVFGTLQSLRVPVRISPSSEGVEGKTGYVGLPTQVVLSRRLVFEMNQAS